MGGQQRLPGKAVSIMVITIGRQFGSGGREIGRRLAEKLGFEYYDKELLTKVAQKNGYDEELVTEYDEKPNSSLIYSLYAGTMAATNVVPISQKLAAAQFDEIRSLAEQGVNCVVIGRCADYVLKDHSECAHVFVYAPLEARKTRVIETENIPKEVVEKYILRRDKNRQKYYEFYTGRDWGSMVNHDLCINSAALGIDASVDVICDFVKKKLNIG